MPLRPRSHRSTSRRAPTIRPPAGRRQQRSILKYLYGDRWSPVPALTVDRFTEILTLVGLSTAQRHRLHQIVERTAGEKHQALLAFLGVPDDAVETIRRSSAAASDPPGGARSEVAVAPCPGPTLR